MMNIVTESVKYSSMIAVEKYSMLHKKLYIIIESEDNYYIYNFRTRKYYLVNLIDNDYSSQYCDMGIYPMKNSSLMTLEEIRKSGPKNILETNGNYINFYGIEESFDYNKILIAIKEYDNSKMIEENETKEVAKIVQSFTESLNQRKIINQVYMFHNSTISLATLNNYIRIDRSENDETNYFIVHYIPHNKNGGHGIESPELDNYLRTHYDCHYNNYYSNYTQLIEYYTNDNELKEKVEKVLDIIEAP